MSEQSCPSSEYIVVLGRLVSEALFERLQIVGRGSSIGGNTVSGTGGKFEHRRIGECRPGDALT